jgi:hypothetical protein
MVQQAPIVPFNFIAPADKGYMFTGSYSRQITCLGDKCWAYWTGYALVLPDTLSSELNIITPSQQRGLANRHALELPSGARITSLAFQPLGDLELGSPGGLLKFGSSLAEPVTGANVQNVVSTPADGTTLAKPEVPFKKVLPLTPIAANISPTPTIWKIYPTDASGTAPSTVMATKKTKILAAIGFYVQCPFPTEGDVGYAPPEDIQA